MNKKETIKKACAIVTKHGFELPIDIQKSVDSLDNPQFRVAVVGKFQVGKSTLINELFLDGKKLLIEGRGLCTTALATDVEYGDKSTLSVYRWEDEARSKEILETSIDNPSQEDVDKATVSNTMETRAALAQKISRVVITEPVNALKGYTITDTPGLDDPNEELLLNTTYKVIPNSDVALLLVECKSLDTVERNLLRKGLIGKGISRLMILVSYKPELDLAADQRKAIVDTIKAELAAIGQEDLPVEIYCFDPSVDDVLCDKLQIRTAIRAYLNNNAMAGREERVAYQVKNVLEHKLIEIASKIKMAAATDADKEAFNKKINDNIKKIDEESQRLHAAFEDDIKAIETRFLRQAKFSSDEIFDDFLIKIKNAENLDALQLEVENAENSLQRQIIEKTSEIGVNLRKELKDVIENHTSSFVQIARINDEFLDEELDIKRPAISKVPSIIWDLLDVGLLNFILPGGWIIAILAKLLTRKSLYPGKWIAEKIIVAQIETLIKNTKPEVSKMIQEQLKQSIASTFTEIKANLKVSNEEQVATMRAAIELRPVESSEVVKLKEAKKEIEEILGKL